MYRIIKDVKMTSERRLLHVISFLRHCELHDQQTTDQSLPQMLPIVAVHRQSLTSQISSLDTRYDCRLQLRIVSSILAAGTIIGRLIQLRHHRRHYQAVGSNYRASTIMERSIQIIERDSGDTLSICVSGRYLHCAGPDVSVA